MSWLSDIARPDIVALKPYEHASNRSRTSNACTRMSVPWRAEGDANPAAGLNRYPGAATARAGGDAACRALRGANPIRYW